jgi:hypothetical protein
MSASTVHAVLVRCRLNRLSHIDIRTGDPITLTGDSYERDHSGSLAHVDVKKPGNIPVGGGVALCRKDPGHKEPLLQVAHLALCVCRTADSAHADPPIPPQTNDKIDTFNRTTAQGWAFARHDTNERSRRSALPAWLHTYNHHRQHSAIGTVPSITRLTSLPGQCS